MAITSFKELLAKSEKPVLVDFWAPWCGPCRMMGPVIEQIAKEYSGRLMVVKINTEEKQHLAAEYQIASIPTVMMFWQGQVIMQLMGAQPFEAVKQQIQAHWPKLS